MSGFFTVGEKKDRPGIYKRRENIGSVETAGAREGIGAAVVKGNWGPLGVASVVDAAEDYRKYVGTGTGYDVLTELFKGGVQTAVVVRVGTGGTQASVKLNDNAETGVPVLTVTAKYPGTFPLSVSVKDSLADSTTKVVTIYTGTTVLESVSLVSGTKEVDEAVEAFADSAYVKVSKIAAGSGTLKEVTQVELTGGADPTVKTEDYSAAFNVANTEIWDSICVDTNDTDVHALLASFVDRIFNAGDYPLATVSEPVSVDLADRETHCAAFNDEKMHYVIDGWTDANGNTYDGYIAAARIAGMIGAIAANDSLTHKTIDGAVGLAEAMTNSDIVKAIKAGGLVISKSKSGQVMIEKGINTLTTLSGDMDQGWKKIRRTKTRFEMMSRIDETLEAFVGAVNNDDDGRASIIAAGQGVLDAMIGEGKLLSGATFSLDDTNPPSGDSAWFVIQADDIDSFETGYLTYQFRFTAPAEEE